MPIGSEKEYKKGVQDGIDNAANGTDKSKYPNARGFMIAVLSGIVVGAIIGAILFATSALSFGAGPLIGFGALIGGVAAAGLTGGTFVQRGYYRSEGEKVGKCTYNDIAYQRQRDGQGISQMKGQEQEVSPVLDEQRWRNQVGGVQADSFVHQAKQGNNQGRVAGLG